MTKKNTKGKKKTMSQWLLLILGSILTIWFMLPLFTSCTVNIGNVTGIALGILVILLGLFANPFGAFLVKIWQSAGGKLVISLVGLFVAIILGLAIMCSAFMLGAATKPVEENATVVVLGCRVYGERPSLMLRERLNAAYKYLEKNPEAVCIVSGGKGDGENIPEAEAMYEYLVDKGIDPSRIYKEDKSASTRENLAFSNEIIQREGLNTNLAVATNEFHQWRAGQIAKDLGLSSGALSARTAWWLFPTFTVREMWGIMYEIVFP